MTLSKPRWAHESKQNKTKQKKNKQNNQLAQRNISIQLSQSKTINNQVLLFNNKLLYTNTEKIYEQ